MMLSKDTVAHPFSWNCPRNIKLIRKDNFSFVVFLALAVKSIPQPEEKSLNFNNKLDYINL